MKLANLVAAQECGALKVGENCSHNNIIVGGVSVTEAQCKGIVKTLGWIDWDKQAWEIIDKTNKFIRGIKNHIDNEAILSSTEVTFQNRRRQNTEKYFDRIKMVGPLFDITILYGMHGTGGTYSVYDGSNGFSQPVFNCRTAKQLGEYINSLA